MSSRALLFIFLLAVTASSYSYGIQPQSAPPPSVDATLEVPTIPATVDVPKVRTKRGVFWDFFQKVGITKNLVVDQFVDTKNTLNEVYNMLNEQFSDPAPKKPTLPSTSTESPKFNDSGDEDNSTEISTTTERFRISRYELGRILGRNYRGLQRLMKIELKDALNQTHYNIQEYKAEANKQFANSLGVEKKNKLKQLKLLKG